MTTILVSWVLSALCLFITAKLVAGFKIDSFLSAMLASVLVGFFNAFLWPLLIFLTLPLNILTLGLFTFVVNATILKISASFIKGFDIDGWGPAILGALVLVLVRWMIFWLFGTA